MNEDAFDSMELSFTVLLLFYYGKFLTYSKKEKIVQSTPESIVWWFEKHLVRYIVFCLQNSITQALERKRSAVEEISKTIK